MPLLTMHQSTPRRYLAAVVSVLAVSVWAWLSVRETSPVRSLVAPNAPVRLHAEPVLAVTPGSARQTAEAAPVVPTPAPVFHCSAQRLEFDAGGRNQPQCVGPATPLQNGSMRSYRAEPRDSGAKWLVVDAGGSQVVGASMGQGGEAEFACEGVVCAGVVLGPPDLRGVRAIALNGVRLASVAAPGAATAYATLSGTVTTAVDETAQSATCAEQSVLVSAQGAPTQRFCPDDGTGIDNADPLGPVYTFSSADGAGITVALDRDGRVRRVDQGARSCEGAACARVTVSSRGAGRGRQIDFQGTLLQQAGTAGAWTGLTGRLVIP